MYEVTRDGIPKGARLGDRGFVYLDWVHIFGDNSGTPSALAILVCTLLSI